MSTYFHLAHFHLSPRRGRGAGLTVHLRTVIWLLALVSLAACAVNRETADITPGANLLTAMGYVATTGPEANKPKDIDAIVTYRDKWMWDMTMYMLELDVTLRNAQSNYPMAVGNSFHTSLTRKSPEEMVKEVLSNI